MLTHARLDKRMNTKIVSIFIFSSRCCPHRSSIKSEFYPIFPSTHLDRVWAEKNQVHVLSILRKRSFFNICSKGSIIYFIEGSFSSLEDDLHIASSNWWNSSLQVNLEEKICICLVLIWANIPNTHVLTDQFCHGMETFH